jgi:FkbM family methyltransferase
MGRVRAAVAEVPGARRARQAATRRPVWPVRCARHVAEPLRLAFNEATWRRAVASYALRSSRLGVRLRHPYRDVWIFDEIFHRRVYEVPAPVESAVRQLGRPPRILDVGAHVGLAGVFFLSRWPDAHLTAVEPDPENLAVLQATMRMNAAPERWRVCEALAGVTPRTTRFISDGHLSRSAGRGDDAATIEVPQIDVFPLLAQADIAKLDIQGGEWPILADERLADVATAALAVEYHPSGAPGGDALAEVERLLGRAGFTRVSSVRDAHAGEGTVWAIRSNLTSAS